MAVAFYASSEIYESGLNYIKNYGDIVCVVSTRATSTWLYADFKDASSSTGLWMAGSTLMASTDWTVAAGDISGKKVSMGASSNTNAMTVSGPGTAGGIAILNSTGTNVLYILPCGSQALTTSDQVTIPAFRVEIKAPTSS